jgi:uncharacterized protein YdeI (YjbR/CyaY-like superfamily)
VKPTFFATPTAWRAWLQRNHDKHTELLVGFYKRDSGKASITWPESVDGALCFGWIDGVRRRIDDVSYSIRFTPRKASSNWSAINIKRAAELGDLGLMHATGKKALEARSEEKSRIYAYEQAPAEFEPAQVKQFKANRKAWTFFQAQPASYRQRMIWRAISAKREETRIKRLAGLIEASEQEKRLD